MEDRNSGYSGPERRQNPRLEVVLVTYYRLNNESDARTCSTKNISAGGVCISTNEDIPINVELILKLFLPGEEVPIAAQGRIIWGHKIASPEGSQNMFQVGIRFTEIEDEDRKRIFNYVANHL